MNVCVIAGALASAAIVMRAHAQITISVTDKFAWTENAGFLNWGDTPGNGRVQIQDSFLQGFIWSENLGWINLGDGTSGGGVTFPSYSNVSDLDFGVNLDPLTDELSGFAWSENAGWINFGGGLQPSPANPARVDIAAKRLRGYAWGENIGWLNLDDSNVVVGLKPPCPADLNGDGIVEDSDFVLFAGAYNILDCADPAMASGCPADLNKDGNVDDSDFVIFARAYEAFECP